MLFLILLTGYGWLYESIVSSCTFCFAQVYKLDITGLQNEDGSFSGDMWGEVDTRYMFVRNYICFISLSNLFSGLLLLDVNPLLPNWFDWFRFSYIAICCLSLLCCLDKINVEKAVSYILSCKNLDGGFGCTPGGESHAGQSMLISLLIWTCTFLLTYS